MAFSNREGTPTRHFNAAAPKPEDILTGRRGRKGKGGLKFAVQAAQRTAATYRQGARP